jgi:hypothetical protein
LCCSFIGDPTYPLSPYKTGDTLIAYFNERNNCFTESFEGLQEDCSASESVRCIDECISGKSCSVNGGAYTNTADWIMIDANGNKKILKLRMVQMPMLGMERTVIRSLY